MYACMGRTVPIKYNSKKAVSSVEINESLLYSHSQNGPVVQWIERKFPKL